jgi:Spy/CpxP family protein refolding chaperone
MRKQIVAMAVVGSLLAPAFAAAEDGDRPERGFFVLRALRDLRRQVAALHVSSEQKDEMRRIAAAHLDEVEAASDRAHAARRAVADAVQADEVDEAAIRSRVQAAANAEADLAVLRAKVRHEVRGVLSTEQREGSNVIRRGLRARLERWRTLLKAFVRESLA